MIYNSAAIAIPLAAVSCADRATTVDWRVLFTVASGGNPEALGITAEELARSFALWNSAGIIESSEGTGTSAMNAVGFADTSAAAGSLVINTPLVIGTPPEPPKPPVKTEPEPKPLGVHPSRGVPTYTSEELAGFIEKNAGTSEFLHHCEEIMHRIFNVAETNIILGLREYFGLSENYILLLIDHMERDMNRRATSRHVTVSAVERRAISLIEEGIETYDQLETKVSEWERFDELETRVRKIFGIGIRKLTTKEEDCIRRWQEYGVTDELLNLAYDTTVNATSKPSLAYADKILERWSVNGIKTAADVDNDRKKRGGSFEGSSFDTDDFFKAAIERGYNE